MAEKVPEEFVEFVKTIAAGHLTILEQKRKSNVEKRENAVSFTREIRSIMHSFGDYKKPLWDSVFLVEKILRQQMKLLISKASDYVILRNGNFICCDDLLFLLRKNKVKLKRLLVYLSVMDAKETISKSTSANVAEIVRSSANGKRVKKCLIFLHKIDNYFEFESIMEEEIEDPELTNRKTRKYEMVSNMSDEEYLQFTRTSQTSFTQKHGSKYFLDWVLEDCDTNFTPDELALDMINYLARETIAEILDIVFFLRETKSFVKSCSPSPMDLLFEKINETYNEEEMEEKEIKCSTLGNNAITVAELHEAMKLCTKNTPDYYLLKTDNTDIKYPSYLLCS